ncbi:hypothetical protein J2S05_003950 [Alkalicoccobacillus murimartini]|uniref:Uncharacterized protein n=1 Tax=Alkalicoccobacillus murimartini TaxID=171685 RepID=A0ABT9YNP6_9BACI|nr:hypothetical protein [Alkalicoccobacillus murimartini]
MIIFINRIECVDVSKRQGQKTKWNEDLPRGEGRHQEGTQNHQDRT